jgi:hypothetical protein
LKFSLLDFHRVVFWGGYLIFVTPPSTTPGVGEREIKNKRTAGSFLLEQPGIK